MPRNGIAGPFEKGQTVEIASGMYAGRCGVKRTAEILLSKPMRSQICFREDDPVSPGHKTWLNNTSLRVTTTSTTSTRTTIRSTATAVSIASTS